MSNGLYDHKHESILELLRQGGMDGTPATLLIPYLQRPYAWAPRSLFANLIDSLLGGWPFGTLLLWSFGHRPTDQVDMPHRRFWKEVDRTEITDGKTVDGAALPMHSPPVWFWTGTTPAEFLLLVVMTGGFGFSTKTGPRCRGARSESSRHEAIVVAWAVVF